MVQLSVKHMWMWEVGLVLICVLLHVPPSKWQTFLSDSEHTFVLGLRLRHLSQVILAEVFRTNQFVRMLTLTAQRVIVQILGWYTGEIDICDTREMYWGQ